MDSAVEIYRGGQQTKVSPHMHLPGSRSRSMYSPAQPYLKLDGSDLERKLSVSCNYPAVQMGPWSQSLFTILKVKAPSGHTPWPTRPMVRTGPNLLG